MIEVVSGVRPEDVRQSGRHRLFVEGSGPDAIDPHILGELLEGPITVEPLGPSFSVSSVAEALHPFHPSYYFLIDRDHHHDDAFIERCWDNFPDPATHNLLVWHRQEIENYFLDPEYLGCSSHLCIDQPTLAGKIKTFCRERLYLDAANHVIVTLREELKRSGIRRFSNPSDITDREQALDALLGNTKFSDFHSRIGTLFDPDAIENALDATLARMTGGNQALEFGCGRWLEMVKGKPVLSRLVNSGAFRVEDRQGRKVQGPAKLHAIVKGLLNLELAQQPADFRRLKKLIEDRLAMQ